MCYKEHKDLPFIVLIYRYNIITFFKSSILKCVKKGDVLPEHHKNTENISVEVLPFKPI